MESLQGERLEPHPSPDISSYQDFLTHLDAEELNRTSIHGKPPHIAVARAWFGNAPWFNSNTPSHRPAPSLVHHHKFTEPGEIKIALKQPLQVGWGKRAQVWMGEMTLASAHDVPAAPVCVKIFQESMYVSAEDFESEDHDSDEWPLGAQQARKEAWAYSAMSSIQGREVPWSYAFAEVLLPHGETAYGHIMEFIDGTNGPNFTLEQEPSPTDATIWALADAMVSSFMALTRCGVVQWDVRLKNMIVTSDETENIFVAYVDFTYAEPYESDDQLIHDADLVISALEDLRVPVATIRAWFETRQLEGHSWTKFFKDMTATPGWFGPCSIPPEFEMKESLIVVRDLVLGRQSNLDNFETP